ncbi:MAG: beta-lactamase family protein [Taibaiella sp.]|nr:beta-lactamase family protein [Taibaiella sp.]
MKVLLSLSLFIAAISGLKDLKAQSQGMHIDSFIKGITKSVFTALPDQTQFAYCIIDSGKVGFYGFRKQGANLVEVNNRDSVFEIGSLTKVFTSLLLAMDIEKGTMKPEAPLGSFFNNQLSGGNEKAIISLSNHTSGMPRLPDDLSEDIRNPYQDYSYERLVDYARTRLKVSDTVMYDYSNLGPALLAYILEQQSALSFEEMIQQQICRPAGMKHTTTSFDQIRSLMVPGRDSSGEVAENWVMNGFEGSGGLKSNAADLSKFVLHYFYAQDPAYLLSLQPTFEVNPQMYMAYGWHAIKKGDASWYFHNGGTNGYGCSLLMDVNRKNAIILLTNLSAFHPYFPYLDKTVINIMNQFYK